MNDGSWAMMRFFINAMFLFLLIDLGRPVEVMSVDELGKTIKGLVDQIEMQQFQLQQRVRSDGQSGLLLTRLRHSGVNNYQTETHTGRSAAAGHDHTNYPRTVGLGEFSAVLNGVEFKTRHNDYALVMPSKTSKQLHAFEDIPFPKLPPAVEAKKTLDEKIKELREWFKAWTNQDTSKRDYRPYFKPILCYLEGAWFKTEPGAKIDYSFNSTRHRLDAKLWWNLHEKVQFNAYSGQKNKKENMAFLPTSFFGMKDKTTPQLAQWNYRILCHPLRHDFPLKYLHAVEDLSARFFKDRKTTMHFHKYSTRAVRFAFNSQRSVTVGGQYQNGVVDQLMGEIPGLDNYKGNIRSDAKDPERILRPDGKGLQNKAYYHRIFQVVGKDASGLGQVHRGFNDDYMFAAQNTQEKVVGRTYTPTCQTNARISRKCKSTEPVRHEKWSWAIPLELVYLTPLQAWNPYNIELKKSIKEMTDDGKRDGTCTKAKAFNGIFTIRGYYLTPYSFFGDSKKTGSKNPADTVRDKVCVLNKKGEMKEVKASGVYIHLPKIQGINGRLRTRYPVFPVHGEGSSVWKELNALRDLVMDAALDRYKYKPEKPIPGLRLKMSPSRSSKVAQHIHYLDVTAHEYDLLKANQEIDVTTTEDNGHLHQLRINRRVEKGIEKFWYKLCDGKKDCWDKHKFNIWRTDEK